LTHLPYIIYDTGNIPKDMITSLHSSRYPKKRGITDCERHRIISVISQTMKLLQRTMMASMRSKIRPDISSTQFLFVANSGTNASFTIAMLTMRSIEIQKDLHLSFRDYSKAFYKVWHEDLFHVKPFCNTLPYFDVPTRFL